MTHADHGAHARGHCGHLFLMAALSFGFMYALMYAMVDTWDDVFANLSQAYMAGLMTSPKIVLE